MRRSCACWRSTCEWARPWPEHTALPLHASIFPSDLPCWRSTREWAAPRRCLLPAGLNFSGAYLLDGDDRKHERLGMLVELMQDFDIVLLNEVWACKWSLSTHRNFIGQAIKLGFNVVRTISCAGFATASSRVH